MQACGYLVCVVEHFQGCNDHSYRCSSFKLPAKSSFQPQVAGQLIYVQASCAQVDRLLAAEAEKVVAERLDALSLLCFTRNT